MSARDTRRLERWSANILLAALTTFALSGCGGCGEDEAADGKKWDTTENNGSGGDMMSGDLGMTSPQDDMAPPEEDMGMMEPDLPTAPLVPYTLETRVTPERAAAGAEVQVSCVILTESGEEVVSEELAAEAGFGVLVSPDTSVTGLGGLKWRAERAGEVAFGCKSEALGLVDESPALLTITPGAPERVVTTLDKRTMSAGESAQASCEVFDAYGNLVPDADVSVTTDVMGDGIFVIDQTLNIERAGLYQVSCRVSGAMSELSQKLEVTPNLPAALAVGRVPDMMVYGLGQLVTVSTVVTDRYSNIIQNAPMSFVSAPAGRAFGSGRFRYLEEGLYVVTASVDGPTESNLALTGMVEILVNGTGPDIDCVSPAYGAQVDMKPNTDISVQGVLSDTNGVSDVRVNGDLVNLGTDGSFAATVTARYGINFVDITGTDQFGVQNSRTCVFQVSNRWSPEAQLTDDAIALKLTQDAIDDRVGNDGLDSLNDILQTILNSQGLRDTLHSALVALGNPIYNNCFQTVFGACILRAQVDYLYPNGSNPTGLEINGPNTSSLTLVDGGLRMVARIEDIGVRAKLYGTPPDSTGWARTDFVEVDLTSDFEMRNGRPSISLRQINRVEVGDINLSFSGLTGLLLEGVELFFQNTIRDLLSDTVQGFVDTQFNAALDGIVSGLDVSGLGTTFAIPRLDSSGDINIGFNLAFSSLAVSTSRALFGLATNFSYVGTPQRTTPSLGAAHPEGDILLDPTIAGTIGVSMHVVILNKILHALWRGGFFDATLGSSLFGASAPMGTSVTLETSLPPVLILKSGGKVDLHLGAIRMGITYPGLFEDPLLVDIGATARTDVVLNGDELKFNNIVLGEFYFSAGDVSLDETTRDVLEGFLKGLVQSLVNQSLNGALPSLPIPSFALPGSLVPFGLPPGAELGIQNPAFDATSRHMILDGAFGIR